MAMRERVLIAPETVLVVTKPTSSPLSSTTPPPEEPSCAMAEPPSESTSTVLVSKVKMSFTEPNTIVGKRVDTIWSGSRNCAPYEAITTGISLVGGTFASCTKGNEAESGLAVTLSDTARNAKSYSPVPFGNVSIKTLGFFLSHVGEI